VVHGFLTVNVLLFPDPDGARYARKVSTSLVMAVCQLESVKWSAYFEISI